MEFTQFPNFIRIGPFRSNEIPKEEGLSGAADDQMIEVIRRNVIANSSLYAFLATYFLTSVLALILYQTPIGRKWPAMFVENFHWDRFRESFGFAFWLLVLSPFVAVPAIALAVRRLLRPLAERLVWLAVDFPTSLYVVITLALSVYIVLSFSEADALGKLIAGRDAMSAVANRYAVLDALGTPPRIALQSLLLFMTIYSGVKSSRHRGLFWRSTFFINVILNVYSRRDVADMLTRAGLKVRSICVRKLLPEDMPLPRPLLLHLYRLVPQRIYDRIGKRFEWYVIGCGGQMRTGGKGGQAGSERNGRPQQRHFAAAGKGGHLRRLDEMSQSWRGGLAVESRRSE